MNSEERVLIHTSKVQNSRGCSPTAEVTSVIASDLTVKAKSTKENLKSPHVNSLDKKPTSSSPSSSASLIEEVQVRLKLISQPATSCRAVVLIEPAPEMLLGKRCSFEEEVATMSVTNSSVGLAAHSPSRSGAEELSLCDAFFPCTPEPTSTSLHPAARTGFWKSENPNHLSAQMHEDDDIPGSLLTPPAPMKPIRTRRLQTLFPGKTRRKLDFDEM